MYGRQLHLRLRGIRCPAVDGPVRTDARDGAGELCRQRQYDWRNAGQTGIPDGSGETGNGTADGGFNDILLSGSDAAARSNLGAMGHITAGRGAIPVFGTPPLPCPPIRVKWNGLADLEQVGEQAAVYQDWIRRMCGVFGYPLLDLHQKLIRVAAREGRPLSDYFLDGLHMNEEGNRAIAEAAAPALRKIMER